MTCSVSYAFSLDTTLVADILTISFASLILFNCMSNACEGFVRV